MIVVVLLDHRKGVDIEYSGRPSGPRRVFSVGELLVSMNSMSEECYLRYSHRLEHVVMPHGSKLRNW